MAGERTGVEVEVLYLSQFLHEMTDTSCPI